MTRYDAIGQDYNYSRQPDSRIVQQLVNQLDLPLGSTIADIGAGTGNYSNAIANLGYQVIAIEPSVVMQSQRQEHAQVSWLTGVAENIPLSDNAVDGVIVMLAAHHWDDINLGIKELNRIVSTGKIILFTFEPSQIPDFWLADYFPYFTRDIPPNFPNTQELAQIIRQITQQDVKIIPFLLPTNLSDLFAASGWCRPKIYLDNRVRSGISTFAKMPKNELKIGLKQLKDDINRGVWLAKYGAVLQQQEYDAGYRILVGVSAK